MTPARASLVETPDNPAPAGAEVGLVRTPDGLDLRVARWTPAGACRGTVLIASGRSEYVEKYFETIGDLLARGFCVVAFDWRGQGLSARELPNHAKGHIDDFSLYLRDLETVRAQALEPHAPKPWFALGHSMGGAILLDQAHERISPFERIVLSAPMIDLSCVRFLKLARSLSVLFDSIGLGGAFVPGGRPSSILERGFDGNPLTSDRARFERVARTIAAEPLLRVGDPTIAWAHAAFRLMSRFEAAEYPRQIRTPVLIFGAQHDQVVDSRAAERFAARLKVGRMIMLERSRHEILLEQDHVRERFWAGFDAFIPGMAGEAQSLLARHGKLT